MVSTNPKIYEKYPFIRKALGIGALVLALAGCNNQRGTYNACVDLNNDKKQEVVVGNYGKAHWFYVDYDLTTKLSNPDGCCGEPKLLMRFRDRPDKIEFTDLDGDGDLDLVFSRYGKAYWFYVDYDTFIVINDGKGNFGEPELINRQEERRSPIERWLEKSL